jgi:hypothetical protein
MRGVKCVPTLTLYEADKTAAVAEVHLLELTRGVQQGLESADADLADKWDVRS